MSMRFRCTSTGLALALLCLTAAVLPAQEKTIPTKDLPQTVHAAFAKAYPKAVINGVSTEKVNGKTVYEIESTDGAVRRDVQYSSDGSTIEIEESLPTAQLPVAVRKTVDQAHPHATILKAERIVKGSTSTYEVLVESGHVRHEMEISGSGKLVEDKEVRAKQGKPSSDEDSDAD
jgi:hypothetical protein